MADAVVDILVAAGMGNMDEVERLVGQHPGLLNSREEHGFTPLMLASTHGHLDVVRWLLDHGAAINERPDDGRTALYLACSKSQSPVVRLLLERGADPTLPDHKGWTPLISACAGGHLELVRWLLGHPSAKATIKAREENGGTALWVVCAYGRVGVVRALLESGADPTIATVEGSTPMAVAKLDAHYPEGATAEGRRECVAALEVSFRLLLFLPRHLFPLTSWLICGVFVVVGIVAGCGAGLPAMEGPAGGGCGCELRGAAGGGTEDEGRGQASARGGSAGGAEGSCGGRGR
jgi:hypothetical protein